MTTETTQDTKKNVQPAASSQPESSQPAKRRPGKLGLLVVVLPVLALNLAPALAQQPEPTAAQPTAAQPTAAQPTAAQPTAAQPTAAQPTVAQPTAAQPPTTAAAPPTAVPGTAAPTADAPTAAPAAPPQPTTRPTATTRRPAQPGQPGQPRRPGQMPNDSIHSPLRQRQQQPAAAPEPAPAPAPEECHVHPHINWYQGFLGVNNEKALSSSFGDRLMYRYQNKANPCDAKNQEPPLLGALINLAVVLYVLVRFGKGAVVDGLAKRKKDIMHDIDAANVLLEASQKRAQEYKKRLATIEDRRRELKEEYATQWEAERKRILADAEEKSQRLRKDAEFRIAQERRQVELDLLREASLAAEAAAEDLLKNRIQASDQDRLANEYLSGLSGALKAGSDKQLGRIG